MHVREYLKLPTGVADIYLALSLYGVGMSLIGIFIPIYLITIGYSINWALFYVLITKIIFTISIPLVYNLDSKYGLQGTSLIRLPFFIISFVSLIFISSYPSLFFLAAITGGLGLSFFWLPIHTFFTKHSHLKKQGSEVGKMLSIPTFFKILSPALGGYISALYGFNVLFTIGLLIVSISTAPLFLTKKQKSHKSKIKYKELTKMLGPKFLLMTIADGFIYVVAAILFPLLVYVTLFSLETVGVISSIGAIFFALTSFFIGKKLIKSNLMKVYSLGAIAFALTLIPRPFISTTLGFSIIIILGGLAAAFYESAYVTNFYSNAKKSKDPDMFVVAREIILNISRSLVLILVILIPWKMGFFLAAIMLLTAALFTKY